MSRELRDFAEALGVRLQPWQTEVLRRLTPKPYDVSNPLRDAMRDEYLAWVRLVATAPPPLIKAYIDSSTWVLTDLGRQMVAACSPSWRELPVDVELSEHAPPCNNEQDVFVVLVLDAVRRDVQRARP